MYLMNSTSFIDDIALIYCSHLGGGIENENFAFKVLLQIYSQQASSWH